MAITSAGQSTVKVDSSGATTNYGPALTIITTLFFMWGFVTVLNDIIIPHLRGIFDLNYAQSMLVQLAFFAGYLIFGFPAGKVVEAIGYKGTMVVGLCMMALGALLFLPASYALSYPFFLVALIVVAAGITFLQVSANAYVTVLGKPETAASRLNLTQAFNSLGTTVAPYFGSVFIIGTAALSTEKVHQLLPAARHAYDLQQASSVRGPYLFIASILLALAVIIGLFKLPKISGVEADAQAAKASGSIWEYPHLVLCAVAIFLYVGAEVAIGSFLVNYLNMPSIGNLTLADAARYVSYYWGGAMVGRFIGSALLAKMRPNIVLGVFSLIALTLIAISMLTFGHIAMWTILSVGLFNSIMFPTLFTLGVAELGPLTGEGSGLLIMAIVGGAGVPLLQGVLADSPIGLHHAFILPLLCYLFVAYYGFLGSTPRHRPRKVAA